MAQTTTKCSNNISEEVCNISGNLKYFSYLMFSASQFLHISIGNIILGDCFCGLGTNAFAILQDSRSWGCLKLFLCILYA